MASKMSERLNFKSVEELLGVVNEESAMDIEICKISGFKGHPFKVVDDEKMQELVESIKVNGVLSPVLIRPTGMDTYEMISGHRRLHAAQLAGLTAIPSIIREMTDDEAVIAMVDANIQREELLPSEKAFAYKMKMDAMKRSAGRPSKENEGQNVPYLTTDVIGETEGISGRQVKRYIRLTELIPEILDYLDLKRIPFTSAVELSYLDKEKKPSEKSRELYQYLKIHFSEEFATAITKYLSTDFTAECMLRYIRNTGKCSMEMIVDEMLAILNDRDVYVQKQIEKNRRIDLDDLFIRGFDIRWNEELQDSYVYQIPAIANIDHFEFKSNITFFVGENGSGKSTLLEAFAVACGLNPEGGTANYRFSTYDDYSDLASAIRIRKGVSKPRWSYFLRAESFYNVASALMTKYNDDGKMQDLHARSHGESFLDFIQRADQPGLYIMDEPEAALSPQRQLTLLIHLVKMAQKGAQFVIVTHSPILLAIPDADIFSFDEGSIRQIRYEDTESYDVV